MSTDNELIEEQESQEQKKDKVAKKYASSLSLVARIVGGEKNLTPPKAPDTTGTAKIVADLFKEENEENEKKVKEGLKNLLKKHVEFKKSVAAKKKELEEVERKGMEDFTKAANGFFQTINLQLVNSKEYADALSAAVGAPDVPAKTDSTSTADES